MKSKEQKISNVRVIVIPEFNNWISQKTKEQLQIMDAENLLKEIKRHCDGIDYAHVEYDSEWQCEYCGAIWTEEDSTYNGGCCANDELNKPDGE